MRSAPSCSNVALFLIALSSDFTLRQVCEVSCCALLSPHITFLLARGHSDGVVTVCVCGWWDVAYLQLTVFYHLVWTSAAYATKVEPEQGCSMLERVGVLVSNKTCGFSSQRIWELLSFGKTASPRWRNNLVPCENTHTYTHADAGAVTRTKRSLHVHEDGCVVLSITTLYVGIHPRGLWTGS